MNDASVNYENPPVTETSIGVQFLPLGGWDVHLLGLLWQRIRADFPRFNSAPYAPLGPPQPIFMIGSPRLRGQYTSADQSRLLQIQDDLLFVNWRKTPDAPQYIRYAAIRESFVEQWRTFIEFLRENGIAMPNLHRYQVSYVNHTVEGDLQPGDLLTNWNNNSGEATGLQVAASYRLEKSNIDVAINLQPAVRMIDAVRVMQLTITTSRTLPLPMADDAPEKHLDDLHGTLIDTFQSITSETARALWKRVDNA